MDLEASVKVAAVVMGLLLSRIVKSTSGVYVHDVGHPQGSIDIRLDITFSGSFSECATRIVFHSARVEGWFKGLKREPISVQ